MNGIVTRFAPAPTGYLHLGHARNAKYVWEYAKRRGGRVLLRIEDHDRQRSRPEFEDAIREDLAWLGFVPDAVMPRQSVRDPVYRNVVNGLIARGLVYGCTCTRADVGGEAYANTCRDRGIPLTDDVNWRVRIEPGEETFDDLLHGHQTQNPAAQCGDLMIRDRLGNWTYQWAATVDDHLQGVTHVIRGDDLLDSTGRQLRLARLIGRAVPAVFMHHPLVMKSAEQKLSKSDGDTGIRDLRARGLSADAVMRLC
jgi:glutamyl-tRNA synthetase/glutamyl-Q tRNA(Asp) synthetase